jgi:hypothetical protein
MGTFYSQNDYRNYLEHFGVKGMKWGVRRYQNANGSYTSAGRKRYGVGDGQPYRAVKGGGVRNTAEAKAARRAKLKRAAIAVGGAAALAGAGYLAYKHNKSFRNAAQGLAANAREAGFQARVRGENAAYVAKNRLRGAAKNATSAEYWQRTGRNARTKALRTVGGAMYYSRPGQAVGKAAGNIRQAGRNARTGALRAIGGAVYGRPGQAVGRAAGNIRGRASGLAKKARLGAQGLGDIAKEAKFQAQVRGENAAYVGGKAVRNAAGRIGNAARAAASNRHVRAAVGGLATGAAIGGTAGAIEAARQRKARERQQSSNGRRRRR